MDIRFLGHACFELSDGDTRILIDPFLSGNPAAAVGPPSPRPPAVVGLGPPSPSPPASS